MLIDGILPDMHGFHLAERVIEEAYLPLRRHLLRDRGPARRVHVQGGRRRFSKPVRPNELRGWSARC